MEPTSDDDGDNNSDRCDRRSVAWANPLPWRPQARVRGSRRYVIRQALLRIEAGTRRMEGKHRRGVPGSHHDRAFTPIVAATMLAIMFFRKRPGSHDCQLTKQISDAPARRLLAASPVENRRPREREDPCSFRTRLVDAGSETASDSDDMRDDDDDDNDNNNDNDDNDNNNDNDDDDDHPIKFDDSQCISVGRSLGMFQALHRVSLLQGRADGEDCYGPIAKRLGPQLYSIPSDLLGPERDERLKPAEFSPASSSESVFKPVEEHQSTEIIYQRFGHQAPPTAARALLRSDGEHEDENNMEFMNMPFWHLGSRQKQHTHPATDSIPDDMSVISDVSLIPTYFPSDIAKQQRPHHRALLKRLILAKARAARQTMRQLKRSCRHVVENVFPDVATATSKAPECVCVGPAY